MRERYQITLIARDSPHFEKVVRPDLKRERADRSRISIKQKGRDTEISISAKDLAALQATINGILRTMRAYEAAKEAAEK